MTMTISLSGDACSRSQRRNCQTNIYQFMFLHIPLLCLHILLPLRSRSFLHRFHNICTRCPVERWSTLSLSLSLYFNPFNYELHQSRVSLFSPSRSPFVPAFIVPRNLQHPRYTAFESGGVYSSSRISSSSTW